MQPLEHASNAELLAKLTGKPAADKLVQQYGGLVDLAKATAVSDYIDSTFAQALDNRGYGRGVSAPVR